LSSTFLPNPEFPQQAKKLWSGQVHNRTALDYDAAKALIRAIEMQDKPTRKGTQKVLASSNFKAEGATGSIQFDRLGDRANLPAQLFHIVPCKNEKFGATFLPIEFETAEAAGLNCTNSN
jgi:ABC-type branched-subunit amino acid transport system substrate-binding protein